MTNEREDGALSVLDELSDEEYDSQVTEMVRVVTERVQNALESSDPVEAELLYAAAPVALRNILAHLIALECLGQPRPYRLVKEAVRGLELEGLALAVLKDLQSLQDDSGEGGPAAG